MNSIKPTNVIDEMFPEASGSNMMELDEPMTSGNFNMEVTSADKIVHTEYYNNFADIFDEDNFD